MIIKGEVIDGYGRASRLGFPTANIIVDESILQDFDGVYSGRTFVFDREYPSVIFFDKRRGILESHILDFTDTVRGEIIEVSIDKKIRDTIKFETDIELVKQLRADVEYVESKMKVE